MEKISKLDELLKNMSASLKEEKYYFATVDESAMMNLSMYLEYIVCIYREEEGLSVVFQEDIQEEIDAMSEEKLVGPFALISLNVNSDLMSVGFLAKITEVLAKEKISVNAYSAYTHDHLFVPYERKEDALIALRKLQAKKK
jgi:hypothetical protein